MRHGDRLLHVGLAGDQRDAKALGHGHRLGGFLGREAGAADIRRAATRWARRETRACVACKRKSSKLTCPQPPLDASTRRMKISCPTCGRKSTATGLSVSVSSPERSKITWLVSRRTSSTRVSWPDPPATRKLAYGCVTLNGAEVSVPCGCVALRDFVAADPELAGVLALHAAAAGRHRVALDRLAGERVARGRPSLRASAFEIEVQRLAVDARGKLARGGRSGRFGLGGQDDADRHQRARRQNQTGSNDACRFLPGSRSGLLPGALSKPLP